MRLDDFDPNYINVGETEGLTRGDVRALVAEVASRPDAAVHRIDIKRHYSFFEVSPDVSEALVAKAGAPTAWQGHDVIIERARPRE